MKSLLLFLLSMSSIGAKSNEPQDDWKTVAKYLPGIESIDDKNLSKEVSTIANALFLGEDGAAQAAFKHLYAAQNIDKHVKLYNQFADSDSNNQILIDLLYTHNNTPLSEGSWRWRIEKQKAHKSLRYSDPLSYRTFCKSERRFINLAKALVADPKHITKATLYLHGLKTRQARLEALIIATNLMPNAPDREIPALFKVLVDYDPAIAASYLLKLDKVSAPWRIEMVRVIAMSELTSAVKIDMLKKFMSSHDELNYYTMNSIIDAHERIKDEEALPDFLQFLTQLKQHENESKDEYTERLNKLEHSQVMLLFLQGELDAVTLSSVAHNLLLREPNNSYVGEILQRCSRDVKIVNSFASNIEALDLYSHSGFRAAALWNIAEFSTVNIDHFIKNKGDQIIRGDIDESVTGREITTFLSLGVKSSSKQYKPLIESILRKDAAIYSKLDAHNSQRVFCQAMYELKNYPEIIDKYTEEIALGLESYTISGSLNASMNALSAWPKSKKLPNGIIEKLKFIVPEGIMTTNPARSPSTPLYYEKDQIHRNVDTWKLFLDFVEIGGPDRIQLFKEEMQGMTRHACIFPYTTYNSGARAAAILKANE